MHMKVWIGTICGDFMQLSMVEFIKLRQCPEIIVPDSWKKPFDDLSNGNKGRCTRAHIVIAVSKGVDIQHYHVEDGRC